MFQRKIQVPVYCLIIRCFRYVQYKHLTLFHRDFTHEVKHTEMYESPRFRVQIRPPFETLWRSCGPCYESVQVALFRPLKQIQKLQLLLCHFNFNRVMIDFEREWRYSTFFNTQIKNRTDGTPQLAVPNKM